MDLTITFVIYQTWTDPRLMIPTDVLPLKSVVLPSRLIQHLWVPDTYVVGSKSSVIHKTTTANQAARIWPTGRVLYSLKLTATVACLMSLHNFPMDTETCSLSLQSFAYGKLASKEKVTVPRYGRNHENALFMDINLVNNMPKFKIIDHGYNYSTTLFYIQEEGSDAPQEYEKSRLTVTFEFERYFISVFFQSYFPAMIMVMLGGLTMWIDPKSVPARVSMGITTVLTISTIITGLKSSLPRVSYLTALDIYLWTCYFFVFSAVLEFCVLNFLMARKGRVRDKLVESRFKNGSKSTNGVAIGKSTSGRPPRLLINLYTMRSMTESPLKLSTRKKKPPSTSTRAKV
ncbi:unnamed protein product [Oikopleura dioica]|uniref:Uncharacterized protein n=1 Tax=Oikopleura dioica TaxID=34765 RepID=E4YTC9_OIKDI|nr:unnamed protein product [Oikopleura dioica]